jgi:hypothetical protein
MVSLNALMLYFNMLAMCVAPASAVAFPSSARIVNCHSTLLLFVRHQVLLFIFLAYIQFFEPSVCMSEKLQA